MRKSKPRCFLIIASIQIILLLQQGCSNPLSINKTNSGTSIEPSALPNTGMKPFIMQKPQLTATPTPLAEPTAFMLPSITPKPKTAPLTQADYFIINRNGLYSLRQDSDYYGYCYGLVNAYGNVILPFKYFSIQDISLDVGKPNNPNMKLLYFAQEYTKKLEWIGNGYIFTADGKKATSYSFDNVEVYQKNCIVAKRTKSGLWGVMDSNLTPIVEFKYSDIIVFSGWLAAIGKRGETIWVDFYDSRCRLQNSLQLGSFEAEKQDGEVLLAKGLNGKLGFIDRSFTWCGEPKWDCHIELAFDDDYIGPEYIMTLDHKRHIVNKYGKAFIPKGVKPSDCTLEYDATYKGHSVFYGYQNDEHILFTDEGRIIFHCKQTTDNDWFFFKNDMVFVNGKVFDLSGKELLPGIPDIHGWNEESQLFSQDTRLDDTSYYYTTAFYTKDGKKLPLPEANNIELVSKNRFIVEKPNGERCYYDEKGNLLIPPDDIMRTYFPRYTIVDDEMAMETGEGTYFRWKFGLVDEKGNTVFPKQFETMELLSAERELYTVLINGYYGIIDLQGNWLWYTSIYEELSD